MLCFLCVDSFVLVLILLVPGCGSLFPVKLSVAVAKEKLFPSGSNSALNLDSWTSIASYDCREHAKAVNELSSTRWWCALSHVVALLVKMN